MVRAEYDILKSWKLKLALLAAIVVPTITATGTYYDLKAKIVEKETAVNSRISEIELNNTKNFADKDTIKDMRNDIKEIRDNVSELKTLIIRKSH